MSARNLRLNRERYTVDQIDRIRRNLAGKLFDEKWNTILLVGSVRSVGMLVFFMLLQRVIVMFKAQRSHEISKRMGGKTILRDQCHPRSTAVFSPIDSKSASGITMQNENFSVQVDEYHYSLEWDRLNFNASKFKGWLEASLKDLFCLLFSDCTEVSWLPDNSLTELQRDQVIQDALRKPENFIFT